LSKILDKKVDNIKYENEIRTNDSEKKKCVLEIFVDLLLHPANSYKAEEA